jgi:hypothetical protein
VSGKHHWVGEVDPATCYGFVYLITNTVTDRKYIGRKFYHTYKRKRRVKESNWRVYAGSCRPLQEDIQRLGKDKFTFEIICNYKTRGGVVSGEVHFQTDNDVLSPELLPCGERLYYNGQIGSVKFITPEFLSAKTRAKMRAARTGTTLSAETRAKIAAANTGRTFSAETRAKMRAARTGKTRSAEQRAKVSGEKHPNYKGPYIITFKDGHTEEWLKIANIDGYDSSNLYQVLYGQRKFHKDIVKVERIGSDDR